MNSRPKVGIYRIAFPLVSETFITNQAASLRRFDPVFIVRKVCSKLELEAITPRSTTSGRLRAALFAITGSSFFFWGWEKLSDVALIHAHFGMDGASIRRVAADRRLPLVVTFHGSDAVMSGVALIRSKRWAYIRFALARSALGARASLCIAVSDYVRNRLLDLGYPSEKVVRHYIGVDVERFSPAKDPNSSTPFILCVARHTEIKGIDELITAFSMLPDRHANVRLVLIGDGHLTSSLKTQVRSLGLEARVDFLGAQSSDVVLRYLQRAAIFALFGKLGQRGEAEGLGLVLNEASACEVPVVATRAGGVPEAVIDGETGLLVDPGDVEGFSESLSRLLDDPSMRERMGRMGRELVCERFDMRKQSVLLEELYDMVLKG